MTNQQFIATCVATARRLARQARQLEREGRSAAAGLSRDFARINLLKARAAKAGTEYGGGA